MSVELQGKLINKLPVVSGEGRNGRWEKQEFIIETDDQYPKKICISLWGDRIRSLEGIAVGDVVKASVNIESREYNERWYTDIRAWRIERTGEEGLPPIPPEVQIDEPDNHSAEGDLPF